MASKTNKALTEQPAPAPAPDIVRIASDQLHFDPKNPRFYRLNNASEDQQVIEEMLDDESVLDLMASIGQKG